MISKDGFTDLKELARALREDEKIYSLIYAENGTGKTRLSVEFKNLGKAIYYVGDRQINTLKKTAYKEFVKKLRKDVRDNPKTDFSSKAVNAANTEIFAAHFAVQPEPVLWSPIFQESPSYILQGDTLYFNAFTEDLFYWDNDLIYDFERVLKINTDSRLFSDFQGLDLENRILPHLERYVDFGFRIDYSTKSISFFSQTDVNTNIKISRGEESIFVLCVFLTFVELALQKSDRYKRIRYIYIDDPISSLDEGNIITIGNHISNMFKSYRLNADSGFRVFISTHHPLFFNVICSELQDKVNKYGLEKNWLGDGYILKPVSKDIPIFQHISSLIELHRVAKTGKIYTYHFNMLRSVLEKTASFLGYDAFDKCLKLTTQDEDAQLHSRYVNTLSHGKYSLYNPNEMGIENKKYFIEIVENLISSFQFNEVILATSNT